MAAYMQQQILDALKAALIAASTGCGSNVFVDRTDALQPTELPAILIEADEETIENVLTMSRPQRQRRDFNVLVAPTVANNTTAGATLREICKQVELAIYGDSALNALVRDVPRLQGSKTSLFGEGETAMAQQPMAWSMPYFTLSNQPDASV